MPASRDDIVKLARACLGTPFRHQGRLPGRGLDCAGLIIYISNELELSNSHYTFSTYSHFPNQAKVQYELSEHMQRLLFADARAGDVALVADDGNNSCHMGICATGRDGSMTLIHASARDRKVVEVYIDDEMRHQIRGAFRFRGLIE